MKTGENGKKKRPATFFKIIRIRSIGFNNKTKIIWYYCASILYEYTLLNTQCRYASYRLVISSTWMKFVQVNLNAEGIQFDDPNYCSRARTNHDISAHTTLPAAAASILLMGYLWSIVPVYAPSAAGREITYRLIISDRRTCKIISGTCHWRPNCRQKMARARPPAHRPSPMIAGH